MSRPARPREAPRSQEQSRRLARKALERAEDALAEAYLSVRELAAALELLLKVRRRR